MFSKALLTATYKNARPGQLTEEHKKAEHHRFKTAYLFKDKIIPKKLYAARLIQHFLIIKMIETQLQSLPQTAKSEISSFFALTYLEHLWRTPALENDLQRLGINSDNIQEKEITKATRRYVKNIENLPPKTLLAHFLLHVAGFMHGGHVICRNYIEPSNHLTSYQIPTKQYDFSSAISFLSDGKKSSITLYQYMMNQIDDIALDNEEYEDILQQCKAIYETMTDIYDELCNLYTHQPTLSGQSIAALCISMLALAFILKIMTNYLNPMTSCTAPSFS